MSQLEVNSIDKYSGNNLSVGSSLNLKSYTTTNRDALTSVAGDVIYNSTTNKINYYNGSSCDSAAALGSAQNWASSGGTGANDSIIGGGRGSSTYTSVTQEYSNPLVTTRSVDVS